MTKSGQGPILIAGQTASGKSALALEWARRCEGVVINADSMQVYADLRILTARPEPNDAGDIPHRLYGHVAADVPYSVGGWLRDIKVVLAELKAESRTPIIVGGTGLYFKALLEGLSPIPDIPPEVRDKWRKVAADPNFDLHGALTAIDPQAANRLNVADRHRIARALEVTEATGKPLSYWMGRSHQGLISPDNATLLLITIDRNELYRRCNSRFDAMMANGALEEVKRLVVRDLPPSLPIMRALGVRPLASHLTGDLSLEQSVERAKTETRNYAKRQMTWQRGNMVSWMEVITK